MSCPYSPCPGKDLELVSERRPGQTLMKCPECQKYSVRSSRTGILYPLMDPEDATSLPSNRMR